MKPFVPAFGLKNRHLQTLYSSFFRRNKKLDFKIEEFILSDGDFLEAYWLDKPKKNSTQPIVVLFHGLEGSFLSPYINGIMFNLKKAGYSCVLMHFRSCSGKMNNKAKSYHSGETQDAKEFLKSIRESFPTNSIFAVAYSLGANMLLNLLAQYKEKSPFEATVCISAPLDLSVCSDVMNKGFSCFYEKHLLNSLKKRLVFKHKKHNLEDVLNLKKEQIQNISSIREFDELYTSKINGFKTAENYYRLCSAKQYLKEIKTKTLLIHALDDPFMNETVLPQKDELSSYIEFETHNSGGHIGFIEGSIFKPSYYLDRRIISYLDLHSRD